MKILHYFLGFPPYRTGGLTKYALDLMLEQSNDGNIVYAMWPGEIRNYNMQPHIKRTNVGKIVSLEIINPLPVPIDEGIIEPAAFVKKCKKEIFVKLYEEIIPDVIHIHTLMGLYSEAIEAANNLSIRTVFTTHDYFGICPKVNLYFKGQCCDKDLECRNCVECNVHGLSLTKIAILQSSIYRKLKDSVLIKKLRKNHRKHYFEESYSSEKIEISEAKVKEYQMLRNFYLSMLENVSVIHFNSSVACEIYSKYIKFPYSRVIPITHKDVVDNRVKFISGTPIAKSRDKIRIAYLAPAKQYKGYNVLKEALDQLWKTRNDFEVLLFGPVPDKAPYMIVKEDGYTQSQLGDIFTSVDFLVAPSTWYETFGFTVLEALANGVPVIVSENVGAKDIIGNAGIIVKANNTVELAKAIQFLLDNENRLQFIERIRNLNLVSWRNFVDINYQLYIEEK